MALWASYQQSDSTLRQSVLCQLSLLFPLGSLKTPVNGSKLVLNLSLLFSKVCCSNFLYQAGLPSINVWLITCYANLTSTYPLLGFHKWLECLDVGFRERVRGLVSPTPFMEGCAQKSTEKSNEIQKAKANGYMTQKRTQTSSLKSTQKSKISQIRPQKSKFTYERIFKR